MRHKRFTVKNRYGKTQDIFDNDILCREFILTLKTKDGWDTLDSLMDLPDCFKDDPFEYQKKESKLNTIKTSPQPEPRKARSRRKPIGF